MQIHPSTPLARLTTLGLGGPANVIHLEKASEFPEVIDLVSRSGSPVTCLGWGSNVLASDDGTDHPVLLMKTNGITVLDRTPNGDISIIVQAGQSLLDLVDFTVAEGLVGMETLAGIPGTVGAMPIQNVGAYGQETADTLTSISAWDWQEQQMVTLTGAECQLGHRTSLFKGSHRWTILDLTFTLTRSALSAPITYDELAKALDAPTGSRLPTAEVVAAVLALRRTKGMVLHTGDVDNRSAGSVFLGPTITPAQAASLQAKGASPHTYSDGKTRVGSSWLLRETGYRLGQVIEPGVRVSTKHYTLVADEGSTTARFAKAAVSMRDRVAQKTGITLTFEPDLIGHHPHFQDLTRPILDPLVEDVAL